ncbi:TIGR02300 family protein [Methylocystis parvus]|uniref:TIGR02300 family protein n=1 Tax=Methylocystis parvus TaxID=134 RepID=A0A6B8M4G2_9HYPH|nr:TIGR02300 family protein [Methylocystis parvus]QGM96992.1 TIGR02300 family protein [Methylocystis parvus]WBJ99117.1 TIGR02300 family protein [Methylocystis parvus OBBP]
MAKPELGAKRQCQSCATKFYDLNKDPIICPKCGAIFQVAALSRAAAAARVQEDESEIEKEAPDTVSLDEVEAEESAAETLDVEDDVEIEDTADDDDTFLEEEEGEDDVSGLIDGDIESDDEG